MLLGAGAGTSAYASIALKGSDTLEDVTRDVIAACPAIMGDPANPVTYSGGGSGGGENAMIAATPTQQIAPMSRELGTGAISPLTLCSLGVDPGCTTACVVPTDTGCTGAAPTNGKRVACDPSKGAQELLVGLDGIAVVGANQTGGDSVARTAATGDDCGDSIVGGQFVVCSLNVDPGCTVACVAGTDAGCTGAAPANGKYIFTDWRDVLAVTYGGQYHSDASGSTTAALTINESPLAADPRYCQNPAPAAHKVRNPARISCAGTVRQNLVNNWGRLYADAGAGAPGVCRSPSCVRLKHAFRRGDLSGTTDTFVGLVGLIAIPAFTNCVNGNFAGISNAATANPFCNAGEAPMNKGDSDYLDLDPIRRIADSESAALSRQGMEQVAEGYQAPTNPPTTRGNDTRADPPVAATADFAYSTFQNIGFDSTNASFNSFFVANQPGALAARKSLGVVLSIEIPTNYQDDQVAYWSPSPAAGQAPVKCAPGVFAPSNVGAGMVCPDGNPVQPCLLPVDASGTNFNCMTDAPTPAASPLKDSRVYNLWVVTTLGKFVKDNYLNGSISLAANRQNRAVSAFFRLHTNQVTNFGATPKVAQANTGVCKSFESTTQIGCLTKANPCSIGFAGREAVSVDNSNMAFRIGLNSNTNATAALPPSQVNIENLVTGFSTPYSIARKLWVNAYKGLANVTNTNGATTTHELDLLNCLGGAGSFSIVDAKVAGRNFIPVPNTLPDGTPITITRTKTCPATFP